MPSHKKIEAQIESKLESRATFISSALQSHSDNTIEYRRYLESRLIPIQEVSAAHSSQIECAAGCAYCCHYRVTTFSHELVIMAEYILSRFTDSEIQALIERLQHNSDIIETLSEAEHLKSNIACALLVDNRCTVYSARPLACASCYSPNQQYCKELHDNPNQHQQIENSSKAPKPIPEVGLTIKIEHSATYFALKKLSQDTTKLELNTSLLKVLTNPKLLDEWKAQNNSAAIV